MLFQTEIIRTKSFQEGRVSNLKKLWNTREGRKFRVIPCLSILGSRQQWCWKLNNNHRMKSSIIRYDHYRTLEFAIKFPMITFLTSSKIVSTLAVSVTSRILDSY